MGRSSGVETTKAVAPQRADDLSTTAAVLRALALSGVLATLAWATAAQASTAWGERSGIGAHAISLACVSGALALVAAQYAHTARVWARDGVPGPFPFPFVGNVPLMLSRDWPYDVHTKSVGIVERYGPVFRFFRGPFSSFVWVSDAEAMKRIHTSNYKAYDRDPYERDRLGEFLDGGLIFERNGPAWKKWRSAMQPAFTAARLQALLPAAVECAERLRDRLLAAADGGVGTETPATAEPSGTERKAEVDMEGECLRLTFDMICRAAFGSSFDAQRGGVGDPLPKELVAFNTVLKFLHGRYFAAIAWWKWVPKAIGTAGCAFRRALAVLHSAIDERVAERRQQSPARVAQPAVHAAAAVGTKRDSVCSFKGDAASHGDQDTATEAEAARWGNDILAMLLKAEASDGGEFVTPTGLRQQLLTVLFAGHDTTACLLSFAFYYLAALPDLWTRVQREVREVTGGRRVTFEDLSRLKLVSALCREVLRLHPSAPARTRILTKDDELSGYRLRAGTTVVFMSYTLHRDPSLWADPRLFDPDRFMRTSGGGGGGGALGSSQAAIADAVRAGASHPYAFMAFGAGPRRCIGEPLAWMEARVVLATLASAPLQLRVAPEQAAEAASSLTLRPKGGMRLLVTRAPTFPDERWAANAQDAASQGAGGRTILLRWLAAARSNIRSRSEASTAAEQAVDQHELPLAPE